VTAAARVQTALVIAALALVASVPAASAAKRAATDPPRIAAGVTAGGIDVSGLTEAEATTKIEQAIGAKMLRPVVIRVGSRAFKLTSRTGKFVLDAGRMARGALKVPALAEGETSGGAAAAKGREIGPAIGYSQAAVNRFVSGVADKMSLAPRDASLTMTTTKMRLRRQRGGRRVDTAKTIALVNASLATIDANRALRVRTSWVAPSRTVNGLRAAYPKVITIDRSTFTLRLFTKLAFTKRYGVAVGMAGLSTPAGRYSIQDKQVDPAWHVPHSAWAGSLAGSVIPGGAANNPLKARWMGLHDGVGIHGTSEDWSIGSRASHGCIRMHVSDVKDLFARVSVGTPVLIK
jgi:lipoprotein-anchoring transpeptidase ErfK/SrfK